MKHYNSFENITFEKFSRKKESLTHKEKDSISAAQRQHWRQERKNVRENKRYSGEM
ncbi:hypothetical protein D3C85_631960 [compost metagenome]